MVATTGGDANQTLSLVQRDINSVSPNRDTTQGLFGLPFHANKKWRRFGARDLALATLSATKEDGTPRYPLTLQTNSLATRILFDQTHGKRPEAIGIEYLHGQSLYNGDRRSSLNITGTVRQAHARKEVIISGGVFNSPQLLLLSGIGPKEDLAKLNIPVLVDLPGVGKRLQENQELPIVGHTKQPNIATPFPGDPDCTFGAPGDPCVAAWQNGTGPYARSGINTNAFMLKSNHTPDGELDLLLFAIPFPFRGYWRADANVTIPPDPPTVFDLSMVHIKAQNRAGELKLRSNNPRDTPDINFHFFEEGSETDLGAMADAVAWGRRVYANVAAPYGPVEPTEPPLVGNTGEQVAADYQWIKDQAFGHHASGTCGIGADDDELAVLDSMFRVRGVDGLRVVDGSAFPSPPGAFPVVPTYLISEKASRDILGST
ncbi:hypothetical protein DL546_005646 [Coniochaeta pulveracea]|uniref:Glucose-methanol-choline oxidoreductase N-terminal domain-containing protein n=1 Tax=Coniochaeta pulveracea TaxID=177199 RepID=A0A420YET1_9PEZI|nr:hypothetical protein DL546_005646 [Coniochaeta pulveracea]